MSEKFISEVKPRWVIAENVSGIALKGGSELERVCCGLESAGYKVFPPIDLPSCAFGLPTLERHIWIVATSDSQRSQGSVGETVPDLKSESREFPRSYSGDGERWSVSSARVCGVAEGIPYRVERNRGLGNAVPPPMSEWIGRRILEAA